MRLALVGLGRWARAHAAAAHRSDMVEMVACFTRTAEKRTAFASEFKIPTTSDSWHHVLTDPTIEGVVLSTPNDLHVDMALEAAAAGKAVLVDKPVSVSVSQGLRLLRELPGDAVVHVAHHARRLAGHRSQKRWIESGEAGEVRLLQATFSNNRGAAMAENAWHRRARGAEAGVLIQVGIHQIDNALWLLGPPESVSAHFEHRTMGHAMPDAAAVTIRHTSGAVSQIATGWATPSHYRLHLQATGGNSEYWLDHRHWTAANVDDHGELRVWPTDGEPTQVTSVAGDPLRDQLDDMALGRGVSIVDGLRAMAVVEAAVVSARSGAAVSAADLLERSGASRSEIDTLLLR